MTIEKLRFNNKEFITRVMTFIDPFGDEHTYTVGESALSKELFTDECDYVNENAELLDSSIYCYTSKENLLNKDYEVDQRLAELLYEDGIDLW